MSSRDVRIVCPGHSYACRSGYVIETNCPATTQSGSVCNVSTRVLYAARLQGAWCISVSLVLKLLCQRMAAAHHYAMLGDGLCKHVL